MVMVDQVLVSDDVLKAYFVCDLGRCKGACCEEGDYGAPLEDAEAELLEAELPNILPFLMEEGKATLARTGVHVPDDEGKPGTPLVNNHHCAFAVRSRQGGAWSCGIELAWRAGKTTFRKPISCHLYPIRLSQGSYYTYANYHHWHICKPACHQGQALQVPLYQFLKEPLQRRFGQAWYDALCKAAELHQKP